jgi:uncharacterized protein involved in type VI secretion and phage assembly
VTAYRLVHAVQQIARDEAGQRWSSALGVVRSLHGGEKEHTCTVELRESGVVLPHVPIAVGVTGAAALPHEDDLVVVVFAGGDLHAPVVVGCLYNEKTAPPAHDPGQIVLSLPGGETADDKRMLLTVDTPGDGTRKTVLKLDGSVAIELTVEDSGVDIKAGDARLKLEQTSSSDGRAELSVGDSSVQIEQSGDVTVKASGSLKLEATNIEISGDASVKVAGQTIDLN